MRNYNDLTEKDQGIFIAREEIKRYHNAVIRSIEKDIDNGTADVARAESAMRITHRLLGDCIDVCNKCLNVSSAQEDITK